jgi:4-amino-4-deoxy-L-arabinose transferase-like glycosyltransferase
MIKSFNFSMALLDGALIYSLVRAYGGRPALAWSAVGLLLLNPAVIFDISIWGETESVPLFFLLASMLAARRGAPTLAWALLGLGALTKQTVLVAIIVLAIYYLRSFDWRANLKGCSVAVLAVAAVSLPFVLDGYAPSVALDPTLAAVWVHGSGGAGGCFRWSPDASAWTLVTPFEGVDGLSRLQYRTMHLPGVVTYRATALRRAWNSGLAACISPRIRDQRPSSWRWPSSSPNWSCRQSRCHDTFFPAVLAIGAVGGRMTWPSRRRRCAQLTSLEHDGSGAAPGTVPNLAPGLAPENTGDGGTAYLPFGCHISAAAVCTFRPDRGGGCWCCPAGPHKGSMAYETLRPIGEDAEHEDRPCSGGQSRGQ